MDANFGIGAAASNLHMMMMMMHVIKGKGSQLIHVWKLHVMMGRDVLQVRQRKMMGVVLATVAVIRHVLLDVRDLSDLLHRQIHVRAHVRMKGILHMQAVVMHGIRHNSQGARIGRRWKTKHAVAWPVQILHNTPSQAD